MKPSIQYSPVPQLFIKDLCWVWGDMMTVFHLRIAWNVSIRERGFHQSYPIFKIFVWGDMPGNNWGQRNLKVSVCVWIFVIIAHNKSLCNVVSSLIPSSSTSKTTVPVVSICSASSSLSLTSNSSMSPSNDISTEFWRMEVWFSSTLESLNKKTHFVTENFFLEGRAPFSIA